LAAAEVQALAQMNARHQDALERCAAALAGKPDGPWRAAGIDPEGMDLACGNQTARIVFPRRIRTLEELIEIVPPLAEAARRTPSGPAPDA
jgi:heme iron utilization protein